MLCRPSGPAARDAPTQPLGHYQTGESAEPIAIADNPLVLGPAGTAYASMADWAAFLQAHIGAGAGEDPLIDADAYRMLHTPPPGNAMPGMPGFEYASGRISVSTAFGGGLLHDGSNTGWYCMALVLPDADLGFLVVCNGAYARRQAACGEVSGQLMAAIKDRWMKAAHAAWSRGQ